MNTRFRFPAVMVSFIICLPLHAGEMKGQRVLSAGHSFHVFIPGILTELASSPKINGHKQVDLQGLGGSRVIQHWNLEEGKNKVKPALKTGMVDVLTLSPIFLPDEGIGNFTSLALEHNPKIRVTIQEFWLPFDHYEPTFTQRPKDVDHNSPTVASLKKMHEPYFKSMDDHVTQLNKKYEKDVLSVVPVGQAVIALREKILAGKAPGLKKQSELFTDAIGHATTPLQVLAAYCHYAVIYKKTPVGLPIPKRLAKWEEAEGLNRLLQELAWNAVIQHPLSGVKK